MKVPRAALAFLFTLVLLACGSAGGSFYSNSLNQRVLNYSTQHAASSTKNNIRVTVTPAGPVVLASGATQQFTASVTGTGNKLVYWRVTSGTISSTGFFTAPTVSTATSVQLIACSVINTSSCDQVQITVNPPPTVNMPTASLLASHTCVVAPQSSTLTWATTGATSVTIVPNIGPVAASGTFTVVPTTTTIYTLTASNSAGSVVATTTVTVDVPMVIHAYDPVTGVEQLPAGGPFTVAAGGQLQFAATGGCTGN